MPHRCLITLLLVLAWAAASSQQPQPSDTWKEYAYPQDGLAISMPQEPVIKSDKNGSMYVGFLPNGEKLALMTRTLAGMSDQQAQDGMREGLVRDSTIEPSSIGEATIVGHPGVRAVRVLGNKRYAVRAAYISGRMIKLEAFEGPDADRFFNSLRLVDAEWKEYSYPEDGFRVLSPVQPKLTPNASTNAYMMDVPAGGYVVMHMPVSPASDAGAARAYLLKFRDSMGERWQGKLAAESALDSEFPAIGFEYAIPTGIERIRGRMYHAGTVIYIVLAKGKIETDKFFAGFHITGSSR